MATPKFVHQELLLVEPAFDSHLTDLIIDLNHLRRKKLSGSTHPVIFFQLKTIFHILESLGSARIEGNNTTIAEYIETILEKPKKTTDRIKEILNIEKAIDFIEEVIESAKIDRAFISHLHKLLVHDLRSEGDATPGKYRNSNVRINRSNHQPPDWTQIEDYMEELFEFINQKKAHKYDLLKTAIAHHRFAWIHPFGNGNGRTVRLLTYAMLIKQGFNVHKGRIINPTAIFCIDRDKYYDHLAAADTGEKKGVLKWEEYVLSGLKRELDKVDHLLDYDYLKSEILLPVLDEALSLKYINEREGKILRRAAEQVSIKAVDIQDLFEKKAQSTISWQLKSLLNKKLLIPESPGKRKYFLCFDNSDLLRLTMKRLDKKGFTTITYS